MENRYLTPSDRSLPRQVGEAGQGLEEIAVAAVVGVQMLEGPDTNTTDGSSRPRVRQAHVMHDWRKTGHALTTNRMPIIPSKLPQAEIRESLAPMIGGTDKGSFIPVTFALVPEAREAMKTRYSQPVAYFPFDKDVITPFGSEWDALMCKFEEMFKESSNRNLALKHAQWKGDL
jgi:hypothetical protein